MRLEEYFTLDPFSMDKLEKSRALGETLNQLSRKHYSECPEYKRIMDILDYNPNKNYQLDELPFLPVRIFKHQQMLSVPREKVVKVLTSSGTSGQGVSQIFLDTENARNQSRTLGQILASFIGKKRLPLLYLDTPTVKKDRSMYSARGAGITGFSIYGRNHAFALDADMNLDFELVRDFINKHKEGPILLFGYTYMIWEFVIRALEANDIYLNIPRGILFHIGGWKKLAAQQVARAEFNRRTIELMGNIRVANYYGMAEQLGSVFMECEYGHMHCSNFSEIIVRNPVDFSKLDKNEKGLLELVSVLPSSYPGHAILTEDVGEILGEDDCPCGRKGKYFEIHGRLKKAETRGCSDTFERR